MAAESDSFEEILLNSIDEALLNLGESCRSLLYSYLAAALSLKRDQIPRKLEDFSEAIQDIFKLGKNVINGLILKSLCEKIGVDYRKIKDKDFEVAIEEIKKRSMTQLGPRQVEG